jgi:hypothetical protein
MAVTAEVITGDRRLIEFFLPGTPSIDSFGALGGGAHGVDLTSIVPRT